MLDEEGEPLAEAPSDADVIRVGVGFYAEVDGDFIRDKAQAAQRWLDAWYAYAACIDAYPEMIMVVPRFDGSGRYRTLPYAREDLGQALARIDTETTGASIIVRTAGQDRLVSGMDARVSNPVDYDVTGYLQLSCYVSFGRDDKAAETTELARMVDVYIAALHDLPVVFGQAPGSATTTTLDHALHRPNFISRQQARVYLRGYDWLTVCNSALAARVGGAQTLRDTGAFTRVEELPDHSVLLQATPHHHDCLGESNQTSEAIRPVFDALASLLPPGIPKPGPAFAPLAGPLIYEAAPAT